MSSLDDFLTGPDAFKPSGKSKKAGTFQEICENCRKPYGEHSPQGLCKLAIKPAVPEPMQEPAKPEIPLKTASGRASVTAKPAGFKPGDKVKSAIGEVFTVKEVDPDYPDIEVTDAKGVSYYGMASSFEGVM
jgi:hypothetical protein